MKTTIIIITFLVASVSYAQFDKNTKARLYFQEAQKQFNQNEFEYALIYLEKTKNSLGSTNSRVLSLKIKTLYNLGRFLEAEKALNIFADIENVNDDLKEETLAYFVRIENAANAQREEAEKIKAKRIRDKIKKEIIANAPKMVKVMGGTFEMGGRRYRDERPRHEVTLSDYYIGETEVTVAQYSAATGVNMPEEPDWGWNDNDLIVNVSWNDAISYCKWLSEKLGKTITLPTEAQWEFAARGGNQSKGHKYSGGSNISEVGWGFRNETHRVAKKKANELGLYDMSGNAWEWCLDWYDRDYYSNSPNKNPENTKLGIGRVLRGGRWSINASHSRVAYRSYCNPDSRHNSIGFRVVSF